MCVYSMAMDWKIGEWERRYPTIIQYPPGEVPFEDPFTPLTQAEIDEFRRLLEKAKKYDVDNGEPECELDEKKEKLKKIADQLGVKIEFV